MNKFQFQILTPEKVQYKKEVEYVKLPGVNGEMGILANHAPIVVLLKEGEIEVKEGGKTHKFEIKKGVFRFFNNQATCLILE
jgi:F-type H+-transporting ATPase subunit epsilon